MGLIGRIFPRHKREDRLAAPPAPQVGKLTPKAPRHTSHAARTRKQVVGRRRAMAARKVNVQRLRASR